MNIDKRSSVDAMSSLKERGIRVVDLCHIPHDCRLKTLSFAIMGNEKRLKEILEFGERVDGSSLFSYISPEESDVYIAPRGDSSFANPFSPIPTLNFMCQYLNQDGELLEIAPLSILKRAEEKLVSSHGIVLKALAELEFYLVGESQDQTFPISDVNYHESSPFSRFKRVRNEAMLTLEKIGIRTKYGHAEVGGFASKFGHVMEQHEIEFQPESPGRLAEIITLSRWVIRNVCAKYGVSVSFAPKLAVEHAGNGMHLHLCGLKGKQNILVDSEGRLTDEAKQMIGGILRFSPSLAAFGNMIPLSYLRFISRKESPMHICWGRRNRSALIRIPLWWNHKRLATQNSCRRTFEFRAPDSTANTFLLLAGIILAVEHGLTNSKQTLKLAEDLNADEADGADNFKTLPLSCFEASENLERDREHYEAAGVFPRSVIDHVLKKLRSHGDMHLGRGRLPKPDVMQDLVQRYFNYG